jgi:hypothetical protein
MAPASTRRALSLIFRAKFCAALHKADLLNQAPRQVWKKNWVVHCQAAGQGRQVLNYLARYIFRVAISNSRLEKIENGAVTFRYRDNRSQQLRRLKLTWRNYLAHFGVCEGTAQALTKLVIGNSALEVDSRRVVTEFVEYVFEFIKH